MHLLKASHQSGHLPDEHVSCVVSASPPTFACVFQIAIQQTRRRGDWSGHLSAMHVFVPPHAQSCTAGRVLLKPAASQAAQEEHRGANRAVKVFALQRGLALDDCRELTPALVAPKPASEQPGQAGLPDRLESLVCRAASLSTGLNKKTAPSSGVVGVPDVSLRRNEERTELQK